MNDASQGGYAITIGDYADLQVSLITTNGDYYPGGCCSEQRQHCRRIDQRSDNVIPLPAWCLLAK